MQSVKWVAVGLAAAVLFVVIGCETSFEPFQKSDRAFSLFGYVDASADVQFVRVTPLRDSLYARARRARCHGFAGAPGDRTDVHLARLAFPLRRGSGAQLLVGGAGRAGGHLPDDRAARSDGAASTATFTLPDREPDLGAVFPRSSPDATAEIRKVERLVKAELIYTVRLSLTGELAQRSLSYLDEASRFRDSEGDAGFTFLFNTGRLETVLGTSAFEVLSIDLAAASAGPEWPDVATIDPETLALPDVIGNVEQGVGFVGGIVSKTVRILDTGEPPSKQ